MGSEGRDPHAGLRQELRRGTLVLAVLSALRRERCGADLIDDLNGAHVPIEAGALYPMLRRLEDQGLDGGAREIAGRLLLAVVRDVGVDGRAGHGELRSGIGRGRIDGIHGRVGLWGAAARVIAARARERGDRQ